MKSDLDIEMKTFEKVYDIAVDPGKPFLIRIDGSRFSKYTKQDCFEQPFSELFGNMMKATATELLMRFSPVAVYTSSDEITLFFKEFNEEELALGYTQIHNGRVQKLASLTASFASVTFNDLLVKQYPDRKLATFDARVFNVPSRLEAAKNLQWRASHDAVRNSKQKFLQYHLGRKRTFDLTTRESLQLLFREKDIRWSDLPSHFKYGTLIKKCSRYVDAIDRKTDETVKALRTFAKEIELGDRDLLDLDHLAEMIFEGRQIDA